MFLSESLAEAGEINWYCRHDDYPNNFKCSGLIPAYAASEASRPEMWGGYQASKEDMEKLAACFEYEWTSAVSRMLRHWAVPPTWC